MGNAKCGGITLVWFCRKRSFGVVVAFVRFNGVFLKWIAVVHGGKAFVGRVVLDLLEVVFRFVWILQKRVAFCRPAFCWCC